MARKKTATNVSNTVEGSTVSATAKPAKGTVKLKDNGFKILRTIEVSPASVELVEKFRGRSAPVPFEKIVDLAETIRLNGQLQAIQVREKGANTGEYEGVFGNTRKMACDLLVAGYETNDKRVIPPQPDFKIRCEVVEVSDDEAFAANVVENARREATSPVDDALNQAKLREEYGMKDAAIARLYGYAHQSSVTQLKNLLPLINADEDYKRAIHEGSMTKAAGLLVAETVDPADYHAVWLAAADFAGSKAESVGRDAVQKAIAKVKADKAKAAATVTIDPAAPVTVNPDGTPAESVATSDGAPAAPVAGSPTPEKKVQRTLKQFKTLCEELAADKQTPPNVAQAMSIILAAVNNDIEDSTFAMFFAENLK